MFKTGFILFFIFFTSGVTSAKEIHYATTDHATIYANFQLRGSHALLLAHGAIFNKESWGEFEQKLLEKNYTVLAIDFRGYQKSTQGDDTQALYQDILAGVNYLKKQQTIDTVTVLGASMGGAAAAKANVYSEPKVIDQLILLSPAHVYKPESLKGQLLFIASVDEYLAKEIESAFNKAPEPKKMLFVEGKKHAQHIFNSPQANSLTSIILAFLELAKNKNSDEQQTVMPLEGKKYAN